jgi:hypothetical protein
VQFHLSNVQLFPQLSVLRHLSMLSVWTGTFRVATAHGNCPENLLVSCSCQGTERLGFPPATSVNASDSGFNRTRSVNSKWPFVTQLPTNANRYPQTDRVQLLTHSFPRSHMVYRWVVYVLEISMYRVWKKYLTHFKFMWNLGLMLILSRIWLTWLIIKGFWIGNIDLLDLRQS